MTNRMGGRAFLAVGLFALGWTVACAGEKRGERSTSGECPAGEVCSAATPNGLVFVGEALFDNAGSHLGPIAKGGRFDLGVHSEDGTALPALEFQIEDGSVVTSTDGTGEFNDGNSTIEVDDYLSLRGLAPGTTYVRVVDPANGELYDRLAITVSEIGEIRLTNAHDPDQPFHPGEEGAVGVEIVGADGTEQRAFDLDMKVVSTQADLGVDPGMWDCFLFTPPVTDTMGFDVTVGDFEHHGTMPVQ